MKKVLKVLGILAYIACLLAIVVAIGLYAVNTFAFGGRSAELMRREPMYYYYEPLIDDYVSSLVADRPVVALSCVEPNLLRYYSGIYRTNSDIVKTMDDLYAEGVYQDITAWSIHHTIEWNPGVYSDTLDKLGTTADRGLDLYVRLRRAGSAEEITYIYEVIQRDSFWYLLSVYQDTSEEQ